MKKGFYISKVEAAACLVAATAAVAIIITLSAVYSQEKSKNQAAHFTTTGPSVTATSEPTTIPSMLKEPWQRFRLPDSLSPISYNVTLWPRLKPNDDNMYIFTGNSTVVFKCVKETDLILIHSNRLNFTIFEGHHAVLRGLDGDPTPSLSKTWLEVPTQYLVVQLNGPLSVGHRYELYTMFVGELADDLAGFYRSEYTIDGEQNTICVQIRVWARKKAIESGHGDYALEKTGPILAFLEDHYNSSYPLSKSDQIAIPDFRAGAMENWGLIMYSEPALLYNPATSSIEDKKWVVSVISHELAHMWFGNLVTMRWWNDLWLNEGFATYISYFGSNYTEPKWGLPDLIVLREIINVMGVDALASSHPLSCKEENIVTPDDIRYLFDSITYSKGAAVLRMLSDFITEDAFSKGLNTYLKEFQYNTTIYTDLWKHLQMAVEKAGVKLPYSVDVIMNRWILQMGFPVVTFNTQNGTISQQHFLLDADSATVTPSEFNYTWFVPIKWSKNGGAEQQFWLLDKEKTNPDMVLDTKDWMLANINMKGFYRVNYDSDNWERLLARLTSNPEVQTVQQRLILRDPFRAKIVNITLALRTTKFLDKEFEFMPWQTARSNLDYILLMFDRSEVYGPILAYLKRKVTPLFNYFKNVTANWTKNPEKLTDLYNQENAISLACIAGVKGCKDMTTGLFREWMKNPDNNTYSILHSLLGAGLQQDHHIWPLSSWCLCFRYLQYSLDPDKIRKQDTISTINLISNNVVGQPLAWNFVQANLEDMITYGLFSMAGLISGLTRRFSTEFEYKQLLQFKEDKAELLGVAASSVEESLERIKTNMNWVDLNKEQVLEWFSTEVSSG
uniref:Aminopeptidase n=1 Tax=Takifugu rubripes TaxID=31033 RepID=A0A674MUZ8_TAKRU